MFGIWVLFNMLIKTIKRLQTSLQKSKKHAASASVFLKVTNPPMKMKDFQVSWYPGVVEYVHKIYQTAADVPTKVNKNMQRAPRFF